MVKRAVSTKFTKTSAKTITVIRFFLINFKDGGDGVAHLVVLTAAISMNTEAEGYAEYGEKLGERETLIKVEINLP